MGNDIKLEGLEEMLKDMRDTMKLEEVKEIVKQNGAEMQQAAVQNAPYRTGTLKRSIVGPRILDNGLEAEVDATVHYAPYVEFGTRFMAPRRYMAYALSVQKKIFYSDLKRLFQ